MATSKKQLKEISQKFGTPLYVYNQRDIEVQYNKLKRAFRHPRTRIYYAAKANSNIDILKTMRQLGTRLDVSSPGELYLGLSAGFKPEEILFTGNNLDDEELKYVIKNKVFLNADSLSQLERIGRLSKKGAKVGIRINPAYGAGHHDNVITAGPDSRFGIYHEDVGKAKEIADKHGLVIAGIHQHIGSGILHYTKFLQATDILLKKAKELKDLEFIDFGGGLGIPYKPNEAPLDVNSLGRELSGIFSNFCNEFGREVDMHIEPGRYLVAQAGTLLIKATAIKQTPRGAVVVGTNSGFTHLLRPALYGAYHEIENINARGGKEQEVTVVGNICETTDVFARNRKIKEVKEGDILAIYNTGAYGMSMASRFNGRTLPGEVLLKEDKFGDLRPKVIRKSEKLDSLLLKK